MKDVWLLDTVVSPVAQRPCSTLDELKSEMYSLRREVVALREQFDALMAQLACHSTALRLHKPAALPQKQPTSPIKRIELYKNQGIQYVRAYGHDDLEIEALCGPFEKVGSLLREIAGRKKWAETFSPH